MDYIANDCSISRKTLNQYFKRAELIEAVINDRLAAYHQSLKKIEINQLKPLEEMKSLLVFTEALSSDFSAILLRDLRRYYKEYWLLFDGFIKGSMRKLFITNLTKGINLGAYRKTIDVELLAEVYFITALTLIENESDRLQPASGSNKLRIFNDNFIAGLIDYR